MCPCKTLWCIPCSDSWLAWHGSGRHRWTWEVKRRDCEHNQSRRIVESRLPPVAFQTQQTQPLQPEQVKKWETCHLHKIFARLFQDQTQASVSVSQAFCDRRSLQCLWLKHDNFAVSNRLGDLGVNNVNFNGNSSRATWSVLTLLSQKINTQETAIGVRILLGPAVHLVNIWQTVSFCVLPGRIGGHCLLLLNTRQSNTWW